MGSLQGTVQSNLMNISNMKELIVDLRKTELPLTAVSIQGVGAEQRWGSY